MCYDPERKYFLKGVENIMCIEYEFLQHAQNLCDKDIPELQQWIKSNDINKPLENCGNTLLEYAVMSDSIEVAEFLINNGADIYLCTSEDWDSLIDLAALSGNLNIIKFFLENGFNRNVFLEDGSLMSAAVNNYAEVARYLINQGKDINMHDSSSSMTALRMAAQMHSAECVELLCNMGADTEAESDYGTALLGAVSAGDLEIVKILVNHGANVNYVNNDGSTPYEMAVYKGYEDIAEYLLKRGADSKLSFIKRGGRLPSIWYDWESKSDAYKAAKEGSFGGKVTFCENEHCGNKLRYKENVLREDIPGIFEWLEDNGIPFPNEDDKLTWPEYAVWNNSLKMIKFLVKSGANLYSSSSYEWDTLIEFAAVYGRLDIIKYLLENGYDRETFLKDNSLIFAASNDFTEIIKYLVESGKNIDQPFGNKKGYTALREAAQVNSVKSAALLCSLGANVNAEGEDTPLYIAAAEGNFEIVKLLVDNGADVNYFNKFSTTPYKIAKCFKQNEIADYLLEHSANPNM